METIVIVEKAARTIHLSTKVRIPEPAKSQVSKMLNLPSKGLIFNGGKPSASPLMFWGADTENEQPPKDAGLLLSFPNKRISMEALAEYLLLDETIRWMDEQTSLLNPKGEAKDTLEGARTRLFLCRRGLENKLIKEFRPRVREGAQDDAIQVLLELLGLNTKPEK